ncbi:MAG: antibiotic biosynthesis monooxygenase [Anaerolineae bacterium]|nr:antibiotic biosynthesis monooxygenase [Anaerolineae bacterium]
MYAQVTAIQVPLNQMEQLRDAIETHYLPVVRARPGFRAGYLLEQIDDPNSAQLVLFWDDQASVENFNRTGLLQSSINSIAAEMPGVEVRRQGYVVKVAARATRAPEVISG